MRLERELERKCERGGERKKRDTQEKRKGRADHLSFGSKCFPSYVLFPVVSDTQVKLERVSKSKSQVFSSLAVRETLLFIKVVRCKRTVNILNYTFWHSNYIKVILANISAFRTI